MEVKRDRAHKDIVRFVEQDATVQEVFKSRFDVLDERFQEMLGSKSVDMTREYRRPEMKDDGTWRWLMEQVAPALGKQLAMDDENGFYGNGLDEFMTEVEKHYHMFAGFSNDT